MNNTMEGLFRKLCIVSVALLGLVHSQTKTPQIYYLHVKSDIRYRFATTLVTSKIANSELSPVETHFEVTLPDAAFITEFVMEIDGKQYPGEIKEKAKAKEQYETAKSLGQSAGHIAQKPRHANRFSVDLNIAAESKVTFNLTYQELLERVYGEYEHIIYIDPGQVVKDFRIDVAIQESRELTKVSVPPIRNDVIADSSIEEGVNALVVIERPTTQSATIQYSPTVDDQEKQSEQGISGLFVVEYGVNRTFDAGEVLVVDGYFVHFFALDDMNPIPKDVLFILDVSGSMLGTKLKQQKDAMKAILQDLHEGDRFNIMKFSSNAVLWQSTLLSANRQNKKWAGDYITHLRAQGYTNINDAMLNGIKFMNNIEDERDQRKIIIFLTDGEATTGEENTGRILQNVAKANMHDIAIYSLAFGHDADYEFIKKVAVQNKGIGRKIFEDSDASLQIKDFYDEISSSTLRNVTFKYLDNGNDVAENTTRLSFDTYFDKKELVIAGRLSRDNVRTVTLIVTGNGVDGIITLTGESSIENPVPTLTRKGDFGKITERMWAYLTIKQLLEKAIGESDATEKERLNNRALDLSLKYKFVTPLTSMVVTKPDNNNPELGTLDENEDADLVLGFKNQQLTTRLPHLHKLPSRVPPIQHLLSRQRTAKRRRPHSSYSNSQYLSRRIPPLRRFDSGIQFGSAGKRYGLGGQFDQPGRIVPVNTNIITAAHYAPTTSRPKYIPLATYTKIHPTFNPVTRKMVKKTRTKKNKRGKIVSREKWISINAGEQHIGFNVFNSKYKFPVCFSIDVDRGNALQLLKDTKSGITVNAGISSINSSRTDSITFIDKFVILASSEGIEINTTEITVDGDILSWQDVKVIRMPGIKLSLSGNDEVTIEFGKKIVIKFEKKTRTEIPRIAFLTMNMSKKSGLFKNADGILGSFAHKKLKLLKIKQKGKRSRFLKKHNRRKSRFSLDLVERKDATSRVVTKCWDADKKKKDVLDNDIKNYFISDVFKN